MRGKSMEKNIIHWKDYEEQCRVQVCERPLSDAAE